ncbi:hypothetical protein [Xanthomonas arboricola]|uniref:hypothetical protein n=1 Tax=Xanthomonas arboricola TaxID=56448 RepID=UPI0016956741|nr:hypothetical protein [Xanthomonas arboricola]
MASIHALKRRCQALLRPMAGALSHGGITANRLAHASGGVAAGRRGTRCGRACTCDPPRRKTCSGAEHRDGDDAAVRAEGASALIVM